MKLLQKVGHHVLLYIGVKYITLCIIVCSFKQIISYRLLVESVIT